MSGPRITDAAVEAGAYALDPDVFDASDDVPTVGFARADAREDARRALTAAYPHIRRAVIEELAEKAETEKYPDTYGAFRRAARFHIVEWLRAELEGGDRG